MSFKLALIQQHASNNIEKNIERAVDSTQIAAKNGAQLIAFAELAFTRFYPQLQASGDVKQLAEKIPGPTTQIFSNLAKELGVVIVLTC